MVTKLVVVASMRRRWRMTEYIIDGAYTKNLSMPAIPEFPQADLEQICGVLAETGSGLTGSEIGRILAQMGIYDPSPSITKRHRLYEALQRQQSKTHSGNTVGAFIEEAMRPVRYTNSQGLFESRRIELNPILAFRGYSLAEDGKLRQRGQSRTYADRGRGSRRTT